MRATLGLLVIITLKMYRQALQNIFGLQFTKWFVAITVTQYHFLYYLSRPLPNTMAMPLGNKVKTNMPLYKRKNPYLCVIVKKNLEQYKTKEI